MHSVWRNTKSNWPINSNESFITNESTILEDLKCLGTPMKLAKLDESVSQISDIFYVFAWNKIKESRVLYKAVSENRVPRAVFLSRAKQEQNSRGKRGFSRPPRKGTPVLMLKMHDRSENMHQRDTYRPLQSFWKISGFTYIKNDLGVRSIRKNCQSIGRAK